MIVKTSELTGAALDWAVAKCENHDAARETEFFKFFDCLFQPSINWAQAGPIIEREYLKVDALPNEFDVELTWFVKKLNLPVVGSNKNELGLHGEVLNEAYGPTLPVAALRCYVASKLGDEVEVPDGLLS